MTSLKKYTAEEVANIMDWAVLNHSFSVAGKWYYPKDPIRPNKVYTTQELIELYDQIDIPQLKT